MTDLHLFRDCGTCHPVRSKKQHRYGRIPREDFCFLEIIADHGRFLRGRLCAVRARLGGGHRYRRGRRSIRLDERF